MKAHMIATTAAMIAAAGCASTHRQTAQHNTSSQPQIPQVSLYYPDRAYDTNQAYYTTQTDYRYQDGYRDQDGRYRADSGNQAGDTNQSAFVGARGPEGPAGARGAQGDTGQAGPGGYAAAGPRGAAGPGGPQGEQGPAGARGPAGELVRGPTGEAGQAGERGTAGQTGQAGARGVSAGGAAGPTGPAGPAGPRGEAGPTGERGEALVGPAGPAGRAGGAGERGVVGASGETGVTTAGVAGPMGPAGLAGPAGEAGPIGPMGPTGFLANWVSYRDFWFDPNTNTIHDADQYLVSEIASYMRDNPSLMLGIDASTNPRATSQRDLTLLDNRGRAIRDSLIAAGVPASRITTGMFGNQDLRRDGRVEILLRTDRDAYQQTGSASSQDEWDQRSSDQQRSAQYSENWTTLQSFWFDGGTATLHAADRDRAVEIADYMARYPALRIGIDSSLDPNDRNLRDTDRELAARRGVALRDALIAAGIPAAKIEIGSFGSPDLRREGRVEVLVKTDRLAQSR